MSKKCQKCGYTRQPSDEQHVPDYECPGCGIVYSKYENQLNNERTEKPKESNGTRNRISTICICGETYSTKSEHLGKKFNCRKCGKKITVGQKVNLESVEGHASDSGYHSDKEEGTKENGFNADRIKNTFKESLYSRIKLISLSLEHVKKHPVKITFLTLTFIISSIFSISGLFTLLLFPVFLMGYTKILSQILGGGAADFSEFISFMRHGWNAIWHLFMMLASFLVTLAMFVAPVCLVCAILYFVGGTAVSGYMSLKGIRITEDIPNNYLNIDRLEETKLGLRYLNNIATNLGNSEEGKLITSYISEMTQVRNELEKKNERETIKYLQSEKKQREEKLRVTSEDETAMLAEAKAFQKAQLDMYFNKGEDAYNAWEKKKFGKWYYLTEVKVQNDSEGTNFWGFIVAMLLGSINSILIAVLSTILIFPISSSFILMKFQALEIVMANPDECSDFNLVHQSFSKMVTTGITFWKEVLMSGVLVSAIFGSLITVTLTVISVLKFFEFHSIIFWFQYFALPLLVFFTVLFLFVFLANNSIDLRRRCQQFNS